MKLVGLDLLGCPDGKTGFCLMTDSIDEIVEVPNEEVVSKVQNISPDIVAIGSPLSLPERGNWRQAEEELHKRNIKFVAPRGLLAMEQLVMRGMKLKEIFSAKGFLVIEVSPGAFYDLLNMPRSKNYLGIKRFLKAYDLSLLKKDYRQCEVDSVVAAFVGRLFLEAKVEFLGDEDEGQIVIPKVNRFLGQVSKSE